jgi:hypothetical protein
VMKCVSVPYITSVCMFIAVLSCSTACDNPLHKSIFLTRVLPWEMHSCSIYAHLWADFAPNLQKFVIIWIIVIDRMYRSTANVQTAGCVCYSKLSVLLHQTTYWLQWRTQEIFWGGGGQREQGSGGGSLLVRGTAQSANEWNPYFIRLL